ncbi:NAD(P)-dependent oxidoreductase [Salibacteraceae bacterium]|nr:NAD(P)-dependent oxidoreductase [Salibacteraceae bacterium]
MLKIGILKERKSPPDERVPLSPAQVLQLNTANSDVKFVVESSDIRRFKDAEYANLGIEITTNVSDCDVLMGVKEVPKEALIGGKKYFFFSHTIKMQPYNKELLQTILKKNIQLMDYECLTDSKGRRLLGFGRYAGIVGCYNAFLAYGKRNHSFDLKPAFQCEDRIEMEKELSKVKIEAQGLKIALTGNGRVAHGAMEILDLIHIPKLSVKEYLAYKGSEPVYCQLKVTDYNKRIDGMKGSISEFFSNPELYRGDFARFSCNSDIYIACHFWGDGSPFIFTREEAKHPDFNLKVVADISCDIDGPVASTLRPSTIKDPIYGYEPQTESEVDYDNKNAITVMAVDNLPCELPKDASTDFGAEFIKNIFPSLLNGDKDEILKRASIAKAGDLTERYEYLRDYVED